MTESCFVDTNVLVYARDTAAGHKHEIARRVLADLWRTRAGRLSIQVLQEYYHVVTRRLEPGLAPATARADVVDLQTWQPQRIDAGVLDRAWRLEDRYRLSWWDALIVAAALRSGCAVLLTEDLQKGQVFDERLTVVDPFLDGSVHDASTAR